MWVFFFNLPPVISVSITLNQSKGVLESLEFYFETCDLLLGLT